MRSLRARVLISAAAVLAVFALLTSIALEQAIRESVIAAREERLQAQVFLLMAAGEEGKDGLVFPNALAESRLTLPDSGLYAKVLNALGDPVWQSPSATWSDHPTPLPLPPGRRSFERLKDLSGTDYFVLTFGVTWATGPVPQDYTFVVAEEASAVEAEIAEFRASLATWLGAMTLLLLVALVVVLRWGLKPLKQVARELTEIERGTRSQLLGRYPEEIQALTGNLNALLAHERTRQKRLDNTLGDLAHSLKTPLAVMQGSLEESDMPRATAAQLRDQLSRMGKIVEYQLQRARAGNQQVATLAPPVSVRKTASRIIASLTKVYRDKPIRIEQRVASSIVFRGVEGDLMEMLGNLLDNAFKWSRSEIHVRAETDKTGLTLIVEDDGPGVQPDQIPRLLQRGARADESTPGHGIGLAVVREISEAYGGALQIELSELGGARMRIQLPSQIAGE